MNDPAPRGGVSGIEISTSFTPQAAGNQTLKRLKWVCGDKPRDSATFGGLSDLVISMRSSVHDWTSPVYALDGIYEKEPERKGRVSEVLVSGFR